MRTTKFYRTSRGEALRCALFTAFSIVQIALALPVWLVVLTAAAALLSLGGVITNYTRPMVVFEDDKLRFKPGLLRPEDRLEKSDVSAWRHDGKGGLVDPARFVLVVEDGGNLVIPERAFRDSTDAFQETLEEWLSEAEDSTAET